MPVPGRGRGAEAGRSVRTRGSGAGSTLGKTDDSSERDGREGRSAAKKEKRGKGARGKGARGKGQGGEANPRALRAPARMGTAGRESQDHVPLPSLRTCARCSGRGITENRRWGSITDITSQKRMNPLAPWNASAASNPHIGCPVAVSATQFHIERKKFATNTMKITSPPLSAGC